jgi:polyferredoxin
MAYLQALVELFGLFLVVFWLFCWRYLRKRGDDYIKKLLLFVVLITFGVFVYLEATKIKSRWLLPMFFPFVLYMISRLEPSFGFERRWRGYMALSVVLMVLLAAVYVARVYIPVAKKPPRFNYPFKELLSQIVSKYPSKRYYAPKLVAGNLKYLYPSLDVRSLEEYRLGSDGVIIVEGDSHKKELAKELGRYDFAVVKEYFYHQKEKMLTLYWIHIP